MPGTNYFIDNDGSLWAWGENTYGKLGDGTSEFAFEPIKVMDKVAAINANYNNSAAQKTDGSIWVWGRMDPNACNSEDVGQFPKQVGNSATAFTTTVGAWLYSGKDRRLYTDYPLGTKESVETYFPYSDDKGYLMNDPIPLTLPDNVVRITADRFGDLYYTFVLTSEGDLYYRADYFHQLEKVMDNVKYISNDEKPYIVKKDGSLVRYGQNSTILTNIAKVESSSYGETVLALSNDGKLYAWGRNDYGVVGNGTQAVCPNPKQYHFGLLTE